MKEETAWYAIKNIDAFDSPCLVVYTQRVQRNIQTLTAMVDDLQRLRPHIKTNKSSGAVRMLMDAGINKFKCATIAEASLMGRSSAANVLLAYQPVGPKVGRLTSLVKKYPTNTYSCLFDNYESLKQLSAEFSICQHPSLLQADHPLSLSMRKEQT